MKREEKSGVGSPTCRPAKPISSPSVIKPFYAHQNIYPAQTIARQFSFARGPNLQGARAKDLISAAVLLSSYRGGP